MKSVWEPVPYSSTVMRLSFDGATLKYIEHGDEITSPDVRGICEPSLTCFSGEYFLSLRNDLTGYVTKGADGLHFAEIKPWCFDDGENLGNYDTQQRWISHSDGLFLAYTRKGADNDHVMRRRSPIFIAEVDPEKLCVIRETERVLVPERGARTGNFHVTDVNESESWLFVAEWMQSSGKNPFDCTICEKFGSNNSIYAARILWDKPNRNCPAGRSFNPDPQTYTAAAFTDDENMKKELEQNDFYFSEDNNSWINHTVTEAQKKEYEDKMAEGLWNVTIEFKKHTVRI